MMRKIIAILLAVLMLSGCAAVGDIAGNVAEAAGKELENQVKATLERHKVEVVEFKTAFGKLNDEGGNLQFFCAALVKAQTDTVVSGCAEAMNGMLESAGYAVQTGSKVESPLLVHKEIVFDHSDFQDGTYYIIYGYTSGLGSK